MTTLTMRDALTWAASRPVDEGSLVQQAVAAKAAGQLDETPAGKELADEIDRIVVAGISSAELRIHIIDSASTEDDDDDDRYEDDALEMRLVDFVTADAGIVRVACHWGDCHAAFDLVPGGATLGDACFLWLDRTDEYHRHDLMWCF